jgi:hypothetical protein
LPVKGDLARRHHKEVTMEKRALSAAVVVAMLGAASGQALAASVCYEAEGFEAFIRLDVRLHSGLTTGRERRKLDHPIQEAYAAHGKIVFDDFVLEPINGTVILAQGVGARSAFTLPLLFPLDDDPQFVSIDCYSEEASATPEAWECKAFVLTSSTGAVTLVPDTFVRVEPLENERCSFFELPEDGPEPE